MAIIALVMGLAAVPAISSGSASAVESDTVVAANLSGGCFARHEGSGNRIDIIVEAAVMTSGATSVSVTCHVYQSTPEYNHGHVGAFSAVSAAGGAGLVRNFRLADYTVCAEIHASFVSGPPYNKNCPAH